MNALGTLRWQAQASGLPAFAKRKHQQEVSMGYYGRRDFEGGSFEDERDRWENDRDYGRPQREGSRFDEGRWRGRERPQGYTGAQGMYGSQGPYGQGSYPSRGWGSEHERGYERGYERGQPGQQHGWYETGRREGRGEGRGEEWSRHPSDERGPLERFGDKIREGLRKIGRGPKGFKRSDERICEDVCERIARSPVNAENVEVKVKDGEVTLSGFVEVRYEKRVIEDLADDVFGVTEVHNQLRFQDPNRERSAATQPAPTSSTQGRVTHS
jgi:hypothetical protein